MQPTKLRALAVGLIASSLAGVPACSGEDAGHTGALGESAQPTTCGVTLAYYPIAAPHNNGYDPTAGDSSLWSCDDAYSNSDFGGDHYGNDIWAAEGAPVVATVSGTLTKVGWSDYSGNKVTIIDECGWYHFYCHLLDIAPGIGDGGWVTAGQLIGSVGKTGTASNGVVHLHYSIYPDGYYEGGTDPWPHLHAVEHSVCGDDCDEAGTDEVCGQQEMADNAVAYTDEGSTSDIDGDGRADICGRAANGWACHLAGDSGWGEPLPVLEELSDAAGWSDPTNWATLRLGDVTGDGLADVCGRGDGAFLCWPSTGKGWGARIDGPAISDGNGWSAVQYWSTVRLLDFTGDGKDDLCARGALGIACWPSRGDGWGDVVDGPAWSDANGFGLARYYGTLRTGDVNGDGRSDLCIRASQGIECFLSDGKAFPTRIDGPAWSDAGGWGSIHYWSSIRLVDLDGDGRSDICGRAAAGLVCNLSTGDGFDLATIELADLSDANGWNDPSNYGTLRFADVDGNGSADLCGRADAGAVCWPWNKAGFGKALLGPAISDEAGFGDPQYWRTFQLADIDGDHRADLCVRHSTGTACWPSTGDGFGEQIDLADYSDAGGWGVPQYGATLRIAGPKRCPAGSAPCDQPEDEASSGSGGSDDCVGDCAGAAPSSRGSEEEGGCSVGSSRGRTSMPWGTALALLGMLCAARRSAPRAIARRLAPARCASIDCPRAG